MGVGRRRRGGGAVSTSAGVDDESGIAGRWSFPSLPSCYLRKCYKVLYEGIKQSKRGNRFTRERRMGGCVSSLCVSEEAEISRAKDALGLTALDNIDALTLGSLRRAYRLFRDADADRNGKVDAHEFARMFRLPEDVYLERLVDILDCDGNRTIDFREFIVGLASFVLSGSFGRVRFAFRLFDLDNDGWFSRDELMTAIRLSESRWEALGGEAKRRKALGRNYWGDTAQEDIYKPYRELMRDLERRCPSRMDYDEFVYVVSRHPRVFAPVNHVWNVLREYADPAVRVVRELRRAGNREFFQGTVLESDRADQIFATGKRPLAETTLRESPASSSRCRPTDTRARDDGNTDYDRIRHWLSQSSHPRRGSSLARGLQSVGGSFGFRKRRGDDGVEHPGRFKRTASENLAEELLDQDARDLGIDTGDRARSRAERRVARFAKHPRGFSDLGFFDGDDSAAGSTDDDGDAAASSITMNEIWTALRLAPSNSVRVRLPDGSVRPTLRPRRTPYENHDAFTPADGEASSGTKTARRAMAGAEAAAAIPIPSDYYDKLDVAAVAKRAMAADRSRRNLSRFKDRLEGRRRSRGGGVGSFLAEDDVAAEPPGWLRDGVPPNVDALGRRPKGGALSREEELMMSASKRASKLSSEDRTREGYSSAAAKWKDSASEVFRRRVRAHVQAKPEEAGRLGLRADMPKLRRRDNEDSGRFKV